MGQFENSIKKMLTHTFLEHGIIAVQNPLNTMLYKFDRIKHYAGSVTYDIRNFMAKNADRLDRELSVAMFECQHPLLRVLFPEGETPRPEAGS